jgi:hypothetical protein
MRTTGVALGTSAARLITSPTLAMVGENGRPEAVVPLEPGAATLGTSRLDGGAGGGNMSIVHVGGVTIDRPLMRDSLERDHVAALIAEAITKKLNERDRYSAKR